MTVRRAAAATVAVLCCAFAAGACGSSSSDVVTSGDAGGPGSNPAGCPAAVPASGAACAVADGTRCDYGCGAGGPAQATCARGAWQVAFSDQACPAAAAPGCRSDRDCSVAGEYCATSTPGGITYCATSLAPKCNVDGDCVDAGQGDAICENFLCPSGTGRACFPRCTDAACGPTSTTGLVCGASGRCEAKTCAGVADCPTNFDCTAGRCARRTCSSDAVCQGYCVDGTCSATLGKCEQPRG